MRSPGAESSLTGNCALANILTGAPPGNQHLDTTRQDRMTAAPVKMPFLPPLLWEFGSWAISSAILND